MPFPKAAALARLLAIALLLSALAPAGAAAAEGPRPPPSPAAAHTVYLPLARGADWIAQDAPIWSHGGPPAAHEVALFRHAFTLAEALDTPALALFADTRYEVWVDGRWVGRGPARFSRQTREYDVYQLAALAPGRHLIAVLVQWAPNTRRSESTTAFLQGHLQGATAAGNVVVARTGPAWKVTRSPAWREDAAPVNTWGLLGPTELLDLRRLPRDWNLPSFLDTSWLAAVAVAPPPARFQPRSIAPLASVSIAATLRDSGVLSPGRAVAELAPAVGRASVGVRALAGTTLTIEALAPADRSIALDGVPLIWQPRSGRPDVLAASRPVAAGPHALTFANPPPDGLTFSVSTQAIDTAALPFQQGSHAGRRLLLAEPVSQPGAVIAASGSALDLAFARAPAYAVLDLGRVVHGRVVASVSGPAGAIVDMGWDERLWQGSRPLPYPGSLHPEWNQVDSWVLDGTSRALTTLDARAGRYILIAAWGPGAVRISGLRVYEERYPVAPRGRFSSADALLNRIWQVGADTLYPNMTDAYADPWRERGQWWGDAFVDDHVNQAAFGDSALLRRGLWLMAEGLAGDRPAALAPNGDGTYLLDYGMLWVQSIGDYARRTGDPQLPEQVYPELSRFLGYLARHENAATGLLDVPYGEWWQTALVDWPVYYGRYGQSTPLNALYYGTLRDASDVAELLGDKAAASAWRARAARLRASINSYLYLPGQGRYITSIFGGAPRDPTAHAQAWALAYDVVPEAERGRVANTLLAMLSRDASRPNVEIYGMFWVLEGLGRAGRLAEANDIIRRYYGRLLDLGATTWWESFNANSSYSTSLSHGWGAAPTWFLTTYVLGARQLGPHEWSLRPGVGGTAAAAGALPLAQGALEAAWSSAGCGQLSVDLNAPANTRGSVVVPFADSSLVLTLDGAVVWRDGAPLAANVSVQADGVRIALAGGQHHVEAQRSC